MPRIGRLHIPGGTYHLLGRGLEGRYIFDDDSDKQEFLTRLGTNLVDSEFQCLAWAIMSNHYHLLIRVGSAPIAKLMSPLLSGFAGNYNRRHHRSDGSQIPSAPKVCSHGCEICDGTRQMARNRHRQHAKPQSSTAPSDRSPLKKPENVVFAQTLARNNWERRLAT